MYVYVYNSIFMKTELYTYIHIYTTTTNINIYQLRQAKLVSQTRKPNSYLGKMDQVDTTSGILKVFYNLL
jgi:hypothetical protein